MNTFNFAVSRLVNPQGILPTLTEEQVWKGLRLKVRKPQDFVPAIISCEIMSDTGAKVSRSVVFRDGVTATEEIEEFEGTIAYFDSPTTGTRITNILSYNEENQMVLTFSFAGGIPGFAPTSSSSSPDDGTQLPSVKELNEAVGPAVEHTLKHIRELVRDGTLAETEMQLKSE